MTFFERWPIFINIYNRYSNIWQFFAKERPRHVEYDDWNERLRLTNEQDSDSHMQGVESESVINDLQSDSQREQDELSLQAYYEPMYEVSWKKFDLHFFS